MGGAVPTRPLNVPVCHLAVMHTRPPTPGELESLGATRRAYRAMWSTLRNVPRRAFDGGREDIEALDFIDYEVGGRHPEGIAGAAVIWGGVLIATGALSWAVGDEQHFVLVGDPSGPRTLIFPYARVSEIQGSSSPQFGKFEWLLEEAVLRLCLQGIADAEVEQKLLGLLRIEYGGFLEWSHRWIESRYPDLGRPAR